MKKRLMLLGGIRYLLPVIDIAHKEGYYVITADYLPDNIAHKYSDEYINVSIIDHESVLKAAIDKKINGIMSFGVDPGVVSAAYVQDRLGLPSFGPLESVEILQDKSRFRTYLENNGFNVPQHKSYSSLEEAINDSRLFLYPVIVKPVDSAGSKGVSKVCSPDSLPTAIYRALQYSISGRFIIERFIETKGCSSDSDCFLENGVLRFVSFSSQRFDENASNPYTPAAFSWPSTFSIEETQYLTNELQRLLSLLKMKTGIFNIETRVGKDGTPYIMEVTPRGGGNRLSEMVYFGTGINLIRSCVKYCVGDNYGRIQQCDFHGYWGELILHSNVDGSFKDVFVSDTVKPFIVESDIWVNPGYSIKKFDGANNTIGTFVLHFPNQKEQESFYSNPFSYIHPIID